MADQVLLPPSAQFLSPWDNSVARVKDRFPDYAGAMLDRNIREVYMLPWRLRLKPFIGEASMKNRRCFRNQHNRAQQKQTVSTYCRWLLEKGLEEGAEIVVVPELNDKENPGQTFWLGGAHRMEAFYMAFQQELANRT